MSPSDRRKQSKAVTSSKRRATTVGSANPQPQDYEMMTRPAAEYQSLSPTYAGVPKVYATIGDVSPHPQSNAVFSSHVMPTDYEALSSRARASGAHKVYASMKGPEQGKRE